MEIDPEDPASYQYTKKVLQHIHINRIVIVILNALLEELHYFTWER